MKVTMLGCGTSSGVPRIGGDWGECDHENPRNRRRRASLLVESGGFVILIDTGPDMRDQLLDADVQRLDAVLYTHDHADHAHGIDDLRQLFHLMGRPIDCYAMPATWTVLEKRFPYVFRGSDFYPPTCIAHPLAAGALLSIGPLVVTPFRQNHGSIDSTGFRIEADGAAMAYSTDIKLLPDQSIAMVQGLDLWVVDALRRHPHPTHSHLHQTLGWIATHRPRRAVLTHLDQSMDYATLTAELPVGVVPGHDGLTMDLYAEQDDILT